MITDIELLTQDIDEIRQLLLQKGVEKGTKKLLEEINKEFIGSLTSISANLEETIRVLKGIAQEGRIDKKEILEAIKSIKLEPKIDVGVPTFNIPPIVMPEFPKITVPQPEVTVNPPDIHIPEVKMPKEMKVTGFASFVQAITAILKEKVTSIFSEVNRNNPLPVILTDDEGRYLKPVTTQVISPYPRAVKMDLAWGEVPAGTIDGSNTSFELANTPYEDTSVMIYVNGALQKKDDDYAISGKTITFTMAPPATSNIIAFYRY